MMPFPNAIIYSWLRDKTIWLYGASLSPTCYGLSSYARFQFNFMLLKRVSVIQKVESSENYNLSPQFVGVMLSTSLSDIILYGFQYNT